MAATENKTETTEGFENNKIMNWKQRREQRTDCAVRNVLRASPGVHDLDKPMKPETKTTRKTSTILRPKKGPFFGKWMKPGTKTTRKNEHQFEA
jgi:hypothetical protein